MVTDYYVDHINGDNANTGLSWAQAKLTITAAVGLMTGSDICHCRNGTAGHEFTEIVNVVGHGLDGTEADPTTFITEDNSIINGGGVRKYGFYVNLAHWVKIDGFTVQNSKINNIYFFNNAFNGIIEDVIVTGASYGIYTDNVTHINLIKGCTISNATTMGIRLGKVTGDEVLNNTIASNPYGLYMQGDGGLAKGNNIHSNTVRGLYINNLINSNITENYIHGNNIGVYCREDGACNNSFIYFNDIYGNTTDATDNDNVGLNWDKNSKGNYWGYGGAAFDADGDGIGDAPKVIAGTAGTQDDFPLMCSYTIWPSCPYLGGAAKKHYWHRVGLNMRRF